MGKIGFLFPGQGAQYSGMGKELCENFQCAKEVFEIANEALGFNIENICFNGTKEELSRTEITQPAILTTNMAALKVLKQYGVNSEVAAGLSLGEYSALIHGKALDFKETIPLVNKRGKFMQEAVPVGIGGMVAIIGLNNNSVEDLIIEASKYGVIEGANYNCPGQVVVAGENKALDKIIEITKKASGRAIKLPVSAPFHCSLLEPAAIKLMEELKKVSVNSIEGTIMSNVLGRSYLKEDDIRELLKVQVMKGVLFQNNIENMINMGVDTFIEIGPGKALGSFVKKIDKNAIVLNVEDMKSLENTLKVING